MRRRRGASPSPPSAAPSPRQESVGFRDFEEARGGAADVRVVPEFGVKWGVWGGGRGEKRRREKRRENECSRVLKRKKKPPTVILLAPQKLTVQPAACTLF